MELSVGFQGLVPRRDPGPGPESALEESDPHLFGVKPLGFEGPRVCLERLGGIYLQTASGRTVQTKELKVHLVLVHLVGVTWRPGWFGSSQPGAVDVTGAPSTSMDSSPTWNCWFEGVVQ